MKPADRAIELLDDLKHRGITVQVRDSKLYLKPRQLVDPEVLQSLRSVKAEAIRCVRLREVNADRPDAEGYLLRRLLAGQDWLDDVADALHQQPRAGLDSTLNNRFVYGLDMWLRVEGVLRVALNYNGCIHASLKKTCPGGTSAPCSACMEATN
jgi:hypothetical protein